MNLVAARHLGKGLGKLCQLQLTQNRRSLEQGPQFYFAFIEVDTYDFRCLYISVAGIPMGAIPTPMGVAGIVPGPIVV